MRDLQLANLNSLSDDDIVELALFFDERAHFYRRKFMQVLPCLVKRGLHKRSSDGAYKFVFGGWF